LRWRTVAVSLFGKAPMSCMATAVDMVTG
jgi:hypothetical protein